MSSQNDHLKTKTRSKDPTRTITLRNQFSQALAKRFNQLKKDIKIKIVDEDYFGAQKETNKEYNTFTTNEYSYPNSPEKIAGFLSWLKIMQDQGILETTRTFQGEEVWINQYIQSAYKKGISQANADIRGMGFQNLVPVMTPELLNSTFALPVHEDAVNALYIRDFTSLEGITADMDAAISDVLAMGIAEGRSPAELARLINRKVDDIGIMRAKRLARTEIVRAHNIASINDYERLSEIIGEPILFEWWTANDGKVRPRHQAWHGKIMTKRAALSRLGEPNCRCTILPFLKSLHKDEVQPATIRKMAA